MNEISKEQLVNVLDKYLFGWAYKDIERASIHGDAKLAGFILGACFIDAMAGFYSGVTKESVKKESSGRFKDFSKKYLPSYSFEKLYEDLRCGLVHSYAVGQTYVFTDANRGGSHFSKTSKGTIILNLEDFLGDLRTAYSNFRNDILTDNIIFEKAKKRYLSMSIMGPVDVQNA